MEYRKKLDEILKVHAKYDDDLTDNLAKNKNRIDELQSMIEENQDESNTEVDESVEFEETPPNESSAEIDKSNSVSLRKGQKFDLTKNNPQLSKLIVKFNWDKAVNFEIDYSAYLLGSNEKVSKDEDFIFYNNPAHESGCVEYVENFAQIKVDLQKIPAEISKIAFTLTIDDTETQAQNFSQIKDTCISVVDAQTNKEILYFDLQENFSIENAIVAGEIYRYKGAWKFNAIGAGFSGDLESLCKNFGVETD